MSLTRRRFLTIASAACLVSPARAGQAYHWTGTALGAKAQIVLDHPDAPRLAQQAMAEIDRLEDIFSLYRPASQIARLNAQGALEAPSFELLECLTTARLVHRASDGAFDPTVQPLWTVLAEARQAGRAPDAADIAKARARLGFDTVDIDSGQVTLGQGQALTLNGIAQGYIADRVTALLRRAGVRDVLVDTGEIVALGTAPGQAGWPVRIKGDPRERLLSGRALATSSPKGMMLDPQSGQGHILDPRAETPGPARVRQVSVSADSAALADALSTALSATNERWQAQAVLSKVKGARLESYIPESRF
ncbi:FAD:protein FMN transferase [Actibacterium sp. XHP0104]|uniref:FAD:protein FMN transferase n=1 Tax=Actibacterium sp. XHP0104 TaxID=2984335 RepID=UPI0021E8F6B4|nr:FAD:protein FMN transferase [Actibacterium sp. XHP0104]MCV2881264.1 FAD:protein FMN transferase [Actibacterium sp. XHP0104]